MSRHVELVSHRRKAAQQALAADRPSTPVIFAVPGGRRLKRGVGRLKTSTDIAEHLSYNSAVSESTEETLRKHFPIDPEILKGFEAAKRMFDSHRDEIEKLRAASESFRAIAASLPKSPLAEIASLQSQRVVLSLASEIQRANAKMFADVADLTRISLPDLAALNWPADLAVQRIAEMSRVALPDFSMMSDSFEFARKQFSKIARLNSLAILNLPQINYAGIRENFGLSQTQIGGIKRSTDLLEYRYSKLLFSQYDDQNRHQLPIEIADRPRRDFVYHAVTQMSLTTQQAVAGPLPDSNLQPGVSEDATSLEEIIGQLDLQLPKLLQGARDSLVGTNPDKVRHFCTSLRELFTHILHKISPDGEIQKWSRDPSHRHDGRFTRKARILYVFRHTKNTELAMYVAQETDLTLKYVDLFQKGTHAISTDFEESDLWIVLAKVESTLLMLLRTHFAFYQQ